MTANNAAGVVDSFTSLPYGANRSHVGTVSSDHFTGKYRDSESGLDDFGARYYASDQGRFLIPDWSSDPEAIPYADYENPQSLNLYSYVLNNPATSTDPDGHCCEWLSELLGWGRNFVGCIMGVCQSGIEFHA